MTAAGSLRVATSHASVSVGRVNLGRVTVEYSSIRLDAYRHVSLSEPPPDYRPIPIMSSSQLNLAYLLPPSWKEDIPRWFHEDTPSFDWAGLVVGEEEQEAVLWAKSGGVLAGVPFFEEIFKHVDCRFVHAALYLEVSWILIHRYFLRQ